MIARPCVRCDSPMTAPNARGYFICCAGARMPAVDQVTAAEATRAAYLVCANECAAQADAAREHVERDYNMRKVAEALDVMRDHFRTMAIAVK